MKNIPLFSEASMTDLLDEVRRRSLCCLLISMRPEENASEAWNWRIKGSPVTLGALCAMQQIQIEKHFQQLRETNPEFFQY